MLKRCASCFSSNPTDATPDVSCGSWLRYCRANGCHGSRHCPNCLDSQKRCASCVAVTIYSFIFLFFIFHCLTTSLGIFFRFVIHFFFFFWVCVCVCFWSR